jgi:hypothetical protein
MSPRLVLPLLWLVASPAAAAPSPLAPFNAFAASLGKGMTAVVVNGKDARAFAPLAAVAKRPFGPEVKAAGVRSLRLLGVELELALFKSGEAKSGEGTREAAKGAELAYYVRSALALTSAGPAIVALKGEAVSKVHWKTHDPGELRGAGAPMAATARALARELAGSSCTRLPVASIAEFPFIQDKLKARAAGGLELARKALPDVCKHAAALKGGKAQLRVDDVSFAALDASGKMVGLVKAKLEMAGDKLTLYYGKFRSFAEDATRKPDRKP